MVTSFRRGAQVRHRLRRRTLLIVRRFTPWIAAGWIVVPLMLWALAIVQPPAPISQPPLLPGTTASTESWAQPAAISGPPTVLGQLVIAGDHPLGPDDRSYYDTLISRLRADTTHVESAVATWTDPVTTAIATSGDHRGAYALVWLKGALGSSQAKAAAKSISAMLSSVPAPPGVRAYLAGPAAVFQAPCSLSLPTAAAVLIGVLLLVALAVSRVCRPNVRLAVLAGATAVTLFAAAPVVYLLAAVHLLSLSPLSLAFGGVLTACAAVDFALVITRSYHRQRRTGLGHDQALADAYGTLLRHAAVAAPVLIAMLSVSVFLHTPLLRQVSTPAAVGVAVALLAAVTVFPALISRSADATAWTDSWAWRRLQPPMGRSGLAITAITVCAALAGGTAISAHNAHSPVPTENGPFTAAQLLPDVITIDADHDLRTPDGLAAINTVTRRLLALPGVIRVQSPSAPAGMPWNEATFAYQASTLGSAAQQQAASATSQLGPVKSLASTLDSLDATIARARSGGGAGDFTRVFADVGTGIQGVQRAATAVMNSLAPIQEWMHAVSSCPDNTTCASAQRLIAPFGSVLQSVGELGRTASSMFTGPYAGAPNADMLGQLQSVIHQLRALVPDLSRLLDTVLPQIGSLATSLKGIGQSYGDNTQGAFYLPRSVINGGRYRGVRDSMFSADGHSTRLLVYGALDNVGLPLWQRPTAISQVLATVTRDGTLADSAVTISGSGTAAQLLRDLARHDATALGLCLAFATALGALAMARRLRTVILLSVVALTFLLICAAVWISVSDIIAGEMTWLVLLLGMAIAGPMAVHHHIAMSGRTRMLRPMRQPANVLCLAGITFGLAIWLAPGDSMLHRAGLLIAIGLSANAATVNLSRQSIMRLPATARTLWETLTAHHTDLTGIEHIEALPAPTTASAAEPQRCEQPPAVQFRLTRPPTVRPPVATADPSSRAASRRAKAILRQEPLFFLQGTWAAQRQAELSQMTNARQLDGSRALLEPAGLI